ncbi:ESX secretion-associated protein EspG [Nocardia sp. NPDC059180]|uniref:ESX secretion-associated protein EspG n=1 Tax=Nocardia sp. NPDC059180 TaxID=3346761 RepID=UPI00368362BF
MHHLESTALERYNHLLRRPATGAGLITVFRGPRNNGHTPDRTVGTIRWFDIAGDGRYLETGHRTRTVRPGSTALLCASVAHLLDHADTEYREYVDDLKSTTP